MLTKRMYEANIRWCFTNVARYSTQVKEKSRKESYYKNLVSEHDDDTHPVGWDEAQSYENMPGPKPFPIIGNMWRFLPGGEFHNMQLDQLLERFPERYGKIVRLRGIIGRRDLVYVLDPDDMEHMLRNTEPFPKRHSFNSFYYYRNVLRKEVFQGVDGLMSMNGERWYNLRTMVNPILAQPKTVQQYTSKMDQAAKDLVNCIRRQIRKNGNNQTNADFATDVYKWALEAVAIIALNKRLGALDVIEQNSELDRFVKAVLEMFEQLYYLEILPPYWKFLPSKRLNDFVASVDYILSVVTKYIEEGLEDSSNGNIPENETSVLKRLAKIDKKVAFTMTFDMIMAGVDTTGKTFGATLYFLAKNPDKQKKLREEVLKFLTNKQIVVTTEALSEMPYLKAVIKESTRIAPIIVGTFRTTTKNLVVGGYQIPKGTNIQGMHFYTSNLTDEYFKEPTKFLPERWLRSTNDDYSFKNVHPFAYMPFGYGTRSCIGRRIANLELEVAVANVIRNYELSWDQPDMKFGVKFLYSFLDPLKFTVKELH